MINVLLCFISCFFFSEWVYVEGVCSVEGELVDDIRIVH